MTREKKEQIPKSPDIEQKQTQTQKKSGLLFGALVLVTTLALIAALFFGTFYIIIHNNINGIAEKHRNDIKGIPLLSWALPKPPQSYDPLDPKNLDEKQLKDNYIAFRKEKDELKVQLEEAKKKISELQGNKNDVEVLKAENDKLKKDMESQKTQLVEDKKKIDEIVASGDKEGFKDFFAKVNKETAEKVYKEVMEEEKADIESKNFAQIYEKMDAGAAAKIFEELGDSKIDLTVNVIKNMKKDLAAEVLAEMKQDFAAKITDKLSKEFGINLERG